LLAQDLRRRVGSGRLSREDPRYIRDRGDVDVADVDIADIGRVAVIARPIDLARRQREPADRRSRIGRNRHGCLDCRLGDEGDQRRGIDRLGDELAGDPAPATLDMRPTSVMKRREPPGLVVHPVPAPGLDPYPAARAIGRPIGGHRFRVPDLAVIGGRGPFAVGIELLVAGHRRRDVVGRR
jgi:hypothetical protein